MSGIPENTAGRQEARKALAETRRSRRTAQRWLDEADRQIEKLRTARAENHFTEGVRRMLRGTP
jgi:hypothetical protein